MLFTDADQIFSTHQINDDEARWKRARRTDRAFTNFLNLKIDQPPVDIDVSSFAFLCALEVFSCSESCSSLF